MKWVDRAVVLAAYVILIAVVTWVAWDVDRQLDELSDNDCVVALLQVELTIETLSTLDPDYDMSELDELTSSILDSCT